MIKDESDILTQVNSEETNINKGPSVFSEKKNKINKIYKSKWSNLKFLIQAKTSLKSSIGLQKTKTIEQFSSKCIEIYRKKLEIQFITQRNREMFTSLQFNYHNNITSNIHHHSNLSTDEIISQLKIKEIKDVKDIKSRTQTIRDFLFKFREDNTLMMRLIECLDTDQFEIIVPFL